MKLAYTRAMITSALNCELDTMEFEPHPVFGVLMPKNCPGVPSEVLNPRNTWKDKAAYDQKADQLAQEFVKNFKKYEEYANEEIMAGAPKVLVRS
jgi:phosphoenolpyruvate carboxykinase (ATP)